MTSPEHHDPPRGVGGGEILSGLNDAQREAVLQPGGPMLVLAGAGSGKTRVITHRIAHLIVGCGIHPSRIVAVTFTNKAAAEMRERVEALIGARALGAWIGTFHAFCLRVLRRHAEPAGLRPGFNIYDGDDQLALVRRILKQASAEDGVWPPRSFLSRISRAKNAMETPEDLEGRAHTSEQRLLASVYRQYDEGLSNGNAVDFDDLLLRTLRLYRGHPEIARDHSTRCEQLLVDEYQDTNRPQYLLVRALCATHGNVCVVGDEDQSIYRFRGAELRNILEFEADHPGARTIRLEQNYRSTGTILRAAGAVVANNVGRKGKTLWTENPSGGKIELHRAPDDRSEAVWVAQRVAELESETPHDQMAVLYRTNAQSRLLEEIFRRDRIRYQVVGSVQFYARKEIKDLLAYLKLATNGADDVAFRRIVNTPPRGIGAVTLRAVEGVARATGAPLLQAATHALEQGLLSRRAATALDGFVELIAGITRSADDGAVPGLLEQLIDALEYEAYLDKTYAGLGAERMENVRGLVSAAVEYAEEGEQPTVQGFLDRSALVSDADDAGNAPGVTLMTIHCAKGLEFPVVFLTGLEENLFPHAMSKGSDDDLEEERRLCYVAMTRARQRLLLSHARFRRFQGTSLPSRPSRFLAEVPEALVEEVGGVESDFDARDLPFHDVRSSGSGSSAAQVRTEPIVAWSTTVTAGRAASDDADDGYRVGGFVRHPSFGSGRILDREGSGKHLKLTIHFLNSGPKKILPAYTKLRVEKPLE